MLAQKTLKAKRPYATYFVAAHGGNPMYCGYVTVDGTELNPWFAKGPYISAEEYPLSKQPYPITDWEQLDIQSHSKRRVGSAASLVGPLKREILSTRRWDLEPYADDNPDFRGR